MRIIYLALCFLLGVGLTDAVAAKAVVSHQPMQQRHSLAAKAPAAKAAKVSKLATQHRHVGKATSQHASKRTTKLAAKGKRARMARVHGKKAVARLPPSAAVAAPYRYTNASGDEHTYEGLLPGDGYMVSMPSFNNDQGRAECVELIKGLMYAPRTAQWQEGRRLAKAYSEIKPGTAIATFVRGHYPQGRRHGPHAAIFLRATEAGIYVLDQFANQIGVQQRFIPWHHPRDRRPANNASTYSTVRW